MCRICIPVLFLSGAADQLIPSKMMSDLYNACGAEHKRMARFPNGSHNETWMCPMYYHTMQYFLEEVIHVWRVDPRAIGNIYLFSGCPSCRISKRSSLPTARGPSQ